MDIKRTWDEISTLTWDDISLYQWGKLVLAFMGANSEVEVQGVRVEFSPTVMRTITEMIVNIVVSKRDYKSTMIEYLPWYERKSVIFDAILNAYDKEFRKLEQDFQVVERNVFLDTAIESLNLHERDLGIQARDDLQYDQRREQISSRYRAAFDQTTEETIKNVAVAFSNGDVEVNKTDTPGVYEIKFVGTKGIPDNLDGLKEALNIIIPAHLALTYTFTYNVWDFVSKLTWGDCLDKTWDELRTWNEVS